MTGRATLACPRPGCPGTIRAHGFCGECGHKVVTATKPPPAPPPPPSVPEPPTSRRSDRPRVTSGAIGRGWVDLPALPSSPPVSETSALLEVPEARRFCRVCGDPVGRGVDGEPGPTEGVCANDDTRFTFSPALGRGDRVGRYEIIRCLARGGQGWIYLARDRNLSDAVAEHNVVLKGLIDTDDEFAVAQAVHERRHLLRVAHPNIVKINDFVEQPDRRTGRLAGYIVMEHVVGRSLHDLFLEHRDDDGNRAPLPLPEVLTYISDALRALGHLHSEGLLYCDFKPENVLYTGREVKLIDLGAVVHVDGEKQATLATRGFAAPELRDLGPSVASDIYTVGRALAVLTFDFAGFTTDFQHRLPDREDVPLFRRHESFHRLLRRATHPDPERRFASAEEMLAQSEGVLAEVLSAADDKERLVVSTQFTVERRTFGTGARSAYSDDALDSLDWRELPEALPVPLADPRDAAAGYLAAIAATDPDDVVESLLSIPVRSYEVGLQLIGARIANGHVADAKADLDEYAHRMPDDWRLAWYRGVLAVAEQRPHDARRAFDEVYDALPGELTPKLALAATAEWLADDERARDLYQRVWRTDKHWVSAAFGLARVLRRNGEPAAAVAALDGVPNSSSQHTPAQVAAIRTRLGPGLAKPELLDAAHRLDQLKMGIERHAELSIKVLSAALDWVERNADDRAPSDVVLGHPLEERRLRFGLEKAYRSLATVTDDDDRKIALVRQANRVRPRTLF